MKNSFTTYQAINFLLTPKSAFYQGVSSSFQRPRQAKQDRVIYRKTYFQVKLINCEGAINLSTD